MKGGGEVENEVCTNGTPLAEVCSEAPQIARPNRSAGGGAGVAVEASSESL